MALTHNLTNSEFRFEKITTITNNLRREWEVLKETTKVFEPGKHGIYPSKHADGFWLTEFFEPESCIE